MRILDVNKFPKNLTSYKIFQAKKSISKQAKNSILELLRFMMREHVFISILVSIVEDWRMHWKFMIKLRLNYFKLIHKSYFRLLLEMK
jgi:hypothetical protein